MLHVRITSIHPLLDLLSVEDLQLYPIVIGDFDNPIYSGPPNRNNGEIISLFACLSAFPSWSISCSLLFLTVCFEVYPLFVL